MNAAPAYGGTPAYAGTGGQVVAAPTFNSEGEEINFYPGWGGFYFVSHGWLNIIWDEAYPIDNYYGCSAADAATGACTTALTVTDRDTCAAASPLFRGGAAQMRVARVSISDCDHLGVNLHALAAAQGALRPAYEAAYRATCDSFAGSRAT